MRAHLLQQHHLARERFHLWQVVAGEEQRRAAAAVARTPQRSPNRLRTATKGCVSSYRAALRHHS